MKNKLAKLIDVKSIVTLCLTLVFCVLSLIGVVPQEFLAIYTMIIGFYFGTQATKKAEDANPKYTGPQQRQTAVDESGFTKELSVDQALANEVHPPDLTDPV